MSNDRIALLVRVCEQVGRVDRGESSPAVAAAALGMMPFEVAAIVKSMTTDEAVRMVQAVMAENARLKDELRARQKPDNLVATT